MVNKTIFAYLAVVGWVAFGLISNAGVGYIGLSINQIQSSYLIPAIRAAHVSKRVIDIGLKITPTIAEIVTCKAFALICGFVGYETALPAPSRSRL